MTTLRFIGDFTLWLGAGIALAVALLAFWLYWRETRTRTDAARWLLPTLRSLAIFLLLLALTGPVLRRTDVIGEMARIILIADSSASMGLADPGMEIRRKLLVAQQNGWLHDASYDATLELALESVRKARVAIVATSRRPPEAKELKTSLKTIASHLSAAADRLDAVQSATWPKRDNIERRFRSGPVAHAQRVSDSPAKSPAAAKQLVAQLKQLDLDIARYEQSMQRAFDDYFARIADGGDAGVKEALKQFDAATRVQRLEVMLLTNRVLARLAEKHSVELRAFGGDEAVLWRGSAAEGSERPDPPAKLALTPAGLTTDFNAPLKKSAEQLPTTERGAIVLLTDGQHNRPESPLTLARIFGARTLPIYTVGLGPQTAPEDLAFVGVNAPQSVFIEDRLKGELVVKDELPANASFVAKIEVNGKSVWAQTLATTRRTRRSIPFDFPVKDLAKFASTDGDVKFGAVPVTLNVSLTVLGGERQTNNNTGTFRFLAVTQRPKVLLLDGRPRWEFRYLRNLFERDEQWEVNALLAGAGGGEAKPWPRGTGAGKFPADRQSLFAYHLVVFGDLPPGYLKNEELAWLKEFVEKRGGGIIFVDGRQEQLANYTSGPLAPLLPVAWQGGALEGADLKLALTPRGATTTPLTLLPNAADNSALWARLAAPHWMAPTIPLPATDVLLTATQGTRTVPALVFRRYGAGRVLYSAFEESWRWRFEVADLHHQKFWNQMSRWIMDAPYPVADKHVSLDAGPASYQPGEQADLRAQIRDAEGKLLTRARAEAQLFRDGKKVASLALNSDDNDSGVFRTRTAPLAEGSYEVRVQVEGVPEAELKARASFVVEPQGSAELADLTCNEPLLRDLAEQSGGEYLREEEFGQLVDKLAPLSRSKVVETEMILWQSWWWFAAVVLLLTVEWVLRKRGGML
ncbi:MAG: hypothetical protein HY301_04600 [Verrucomicrobia bacterium]|nr:hypothetical protein [Verrucomicrobiota bacterium]